MADDLDTRLTTLTGPEAAQLLAGVIAELRRRGWSDEVISLRMNQAARELGIEGFAVQIVRELPS